MSEYKNLTYDKLKEIIEDAMFSTPPSNMKITALICEDERGYIPFEQSKTFDRAMKQSVLNYRVGELVKIKNLVIPDRHYYTITKIEREIFHLRRRTKSAEVTTTTTIENMVRYNSKKIL